MNQGLTSLKKRLPELIGTVTVQEPSKTVMARSEGSQWGGARPGLSWSVQPVKDSGQETLSAPGVLVESVTPGVTTTSFTPRTKGERLVVVA